MTMITTTGSPRRRAALIAGLLALALAFTGTIPQPAEALSAYCGSSLTGVDQDYAAGRDNGHPTGEPGTLDGWNGRPAIFPINTAAFALDRTSEIVQASLALVDRGLDTIPSKVLQVIQAAVLVVVNIVLQSLETVKLSLEQQNEQVDACGGTLLGDFVDLQFVTLMEEDLAYVDLDGSTSPSGEAPTPGARLAPSAMFVLPQDGWPAWQRDASLYTDAPGHDDLNEPFVHGALNGDYIGVAVWVRNQIAYMDAVGMDTGTTTTTTDPNTGQTVTVYGAKDLWTQAMSVLGSGDEREAYRLLARAYQTAVTQTPPPGSTTTTRSENPQSNDPTPSETASPPPTAEPTTTPSPEPPPQEDFPSEEPSEPTATETPTPEPAPTNPWG